MRGAKVKFITKTSTKSFIVLQKCGLQLLGHQVRNSKASNILAPINREYVSSIFSQMAKGKTILAVEE